MRYVLTFATLFICTFLFAQNKPQTVSGKVTDIRTHEPIAGVQVIYAKNSGTITDSSGFFRFSTEISKIEITFSLLGYQSISKNINPANSKTTELIIEMEPVINELDEVVVSADKTEKRLSDLSVSMSIIKPIDIIKKHIVNAEDLLNQTQGIEVMDGQASIRGGSGFSYGAGSRVLALVDGLPAIAPDAGNIRWQFMPIENISQIEVIKGASSVLYGSSALNGIINFRTAGADTIPEIKFSLLSGIYDKPSQKNWVWWDTPRSYSNASFSYSKKIKQTELSFGSNLLIDNGYRKLNDEKTVRLNLKLKQQSIKLNGLSYGLGIVGGYNLKRDFILWEDAEYGALKQSESTSTELHGTFFTLDPFISLTTSVKTNQDLKMRFLISDNQYPDNKMNNSRSLSNYTEYQFNSKLFENFDLIIGASHFYSKITSEFYGNHTGNNLAAYAQVEYELFSKLDLSAGIRLEYNKLDENADKIVPVFRTGINYQLSKSTFLRASFGQGYRYPSIAEKHAFTTLGAVKIYPNPEVRPESGWSSEIGLKQGMKVGKILGQTDISIFYSENTDMIEYVFGLYPDPVSQIIDFGFRASNIENSRVYGAEFEFLLNRNFGYMYTSFGGGYTYINPVEFNKVSHISTGTYLKYRRKHSAKLFINVSVKKFELGVNAFYKSKILNIDDVFLNPLTRENLLPGFYDYWISDNEGYIVVDPYFSYRFTNNLKISFAVKNVGNKEYMGRPGDIMPQRFYSLQFSGRF